MKIKGRKVFKNGAIGAYVKQKDGSWKWRIIGGNGKKKQRGGNITYVNKNSNQLDSNQYVLFKEDNIPILIGKNKTKNDPMNFEPLNVNGVSEGFIYQKNGNSFIPLMDNGNYVVVRPSGIISYISRKTKARNYKGFGEAITEYQKGREERGYAILNNFVTSVQYISKKGINEIMEDAYNCKGQTMALTCLLSSLVYKETTGNVNESRFLLEHPVKQLDRIRPNRPSKAFQRERFQENSIFNMSYLNGNDIKTLNMSARVCVFNKQTIPFDENYRLFLLDKKREFEDNKDPIDCFYAQKREGDENILFINVRGTEATSGWEWLSNASTTYTDWFNPDWFNQRKYPENKKIKLSQGFYNALIALICPNLKAGIGFDPILYKGFIETYFSMKNKTNNEKRQFQNNLPLFKGGLIDIIENGLFEDKEFKLFNEEPVNKKIIITGHSRGAIVAHMVTFFINFFYRDIRTVTYTYASPRGFNLVGAGYYNVNQVLTGSRSFRFANEYDSVPHVPGLGVETSSLLAMVGSIFVGIQDKYTGEKINLHYYHVCPGIRFQSIGDNVIQFREWPFEFYEIFVEPLYENIKPVNKVLINCKYNYTDDSYEIPVNGRGASVGSAFYHPLGSGYLNHLSKFVRSRSEYIYTGPNLHVTFVTNILANLENILKKKNEINRFLDFFNNGGVYKIEFPKNLVEYEIKEKELNGVLPIENNCDKINNVVNVLQKENNREKKGNANRISNNPQPNGNGLSQGPVANEPGGGTKGGGRYVNVKNYGRRKVRYYKNGKAYIVINGKKKKL